VGLKNRIEKLEDAARPEPEDERERQKWRERIVYEANRMNEHRLNEGKEPVFEITDRGDVLCTHDGKPVTEFHQTLAEEWYWQFREWGDNPRGLIHDEEAQAYYTPDGGELVFSRDRCLLLNFFWALGDDRAYPYGITGDVDSSNSPHTHRGHGGFIPPLEGRRAPERQWPRLERGNSDYPAV
jgi:hypothetical protein